MKFTEIIANVISFAHSAAKNNTATNPAIWESHLNSLSDDELIMLATFMYFGRDSEDIHENDIAGYRNDLDLSRDRAMLHLVQIAASEQIEKYLRAGLTKASNQNIDINSLV